jgi:mannose-6-phosphate isomerase
VNRRNRLTPALLSPPAADFSGIAQVANAIGTLLAQLSEKFIPDLIVQISDLSSPGGMVVGSELQRSFDIPPALVTARVRSDRGDDRFFVDVVGVPALVNAKILVVDDVVFSGTTMLAVVEKIASMFSGSKLAVACLVVHEASRAKEALAERSVSFFFAATTWNREIRFPWGSAEWYGDVSLKFGDTTVSIETSKRPWGHYEDFAQNKKCTVRLHTVRPNQRMSLQRHLKRDEFFVPLDIGVSYILGETEVSTNPGDYVLVPRGQWHRIINKTARPVRILEVAFGTYDQVNDIQRKSDDYGRVAADGSV